MTQKQKISMLRDTIVYLYEKEGKSKLYISKLFNIDRKTLTYCIKEWNLVKANIYRMTPSNKKFANKNKQLIKSRLDNNISIIDIAKELNVKRDYLTYVIERVEYLSKAKDDYMNRKKQLTIKRVKGKTEKSRRDYNFEEIDGEIWKEMLGYEGYYISNMGRLKKYMKSYKQYALICQQQNSKSGRMYVKVKNKGLQVSRIVGFAFVDGYSDKNNTIDHKDNDKTNNRYDNLQWVSQSENNKMAYKRGRGKNITHSKRGKFKKIILDSKYEFKTIEALSKFLGISWTRTSRYLDGECKFDRKIEIIY